ncbi:MAG: glycosyltransferase family 4 protein [Clostridia bacterium]|nr:glycosyltransferase family 4 protein [Clostridia bacterium]
MKLLILSDVNAPYRVEVFKGLSKEFETVTFFNGKAIEGSDPRWFSNPDKEFDFHILDNAKALEEYEHCLKNITDFDVVLCYDPWHKRSRALQRLCIKKKIPYILNADGVVDINKNWLKVLVKSYYVRRAALCFAGCDRAVEYFKTYGAKDGKTVKHNFTSLYAERILTKPLKSEQKSEFKRKLGFGETFIFLSVGRFVGLKGFELLLEAWGKSDQKSQLVLVGGGPLTNEYERIIEQHKLKNVSVIGYVHKDKLDEYYAAADVFVMPTKSDIWGLVVNEALASGLPVISSDKCTAGVELIKPNVNGLIYDCFDTDALCECIRFTEQNADSVNEMSVNALNSIKNYTYESVIESHITSILSIMKSN